VYLLLPVFAYCRPQYAEPSFMRIPDKTICRFIGAVQTARRRSRLRMPNILFSAPEALRRCRAAMKNFLRFFIKKPYKLPLFYKKRAKKKRGYS